MKHRNRIRRLEERRKEWDAMPASYKEKTTRPGSEKK